MKDQIEVKSASLFSARLWAETNYKIWREKNNVKDCPASVIAYLDINGWLNGKELNNAWRGYWNNDRLHETD